MNPNPVAPVIPGNANNLNPSGSQQYVDLSTVAPKSNAAPAQQGQAKPPTKAELEQRRDELQNQLQANRQSIIDSVKDLLTSDLMARLFEVPEEAKRQEIEERRNAGEEVLAADEASAGVELSTFFDLLSLGAGTAFRDLIATRESLRADLNQVNQQLDELNNPPPAPAPAPAPSDSPETA